MDGEDYQLPVPHVLIFPFPAQSHVNSMLQLAELFCLSGINVTYLITPSIHRRLLLHTDIQSRFSKYQGFHLETLPDRIYEVRTSTIDEMFKLADSFKSVADPFLRELLTPKSDWGGNITKSPVTSIIADGILSVALNVALEIGVPIIYFRTISACAFWTFFSIPQLIEAGEIPFTGNDLDVAIKNVKGMEGFLRRRDLSSFFRTDDLQSRAFQTVWSETGQTPRANGLILNTFNDLEGPILSQIQTCCPNLYTIGPLNAHLESRLAANSDSSMKLSSNSLWEEDRSCIEWLDQQPSKSVLYVSFGSIAKVNEEQLLEFWHGLVNSGVKFLWVIRPDSVTQENGEEEKNKTIPEELERATKERGYMVGWAPQAEVLAHRAVGGFWTHCGWNSTMESIAAGVPMICLPHFGDQQTNSRFVGEVWKNGLDMKDTCDKVIVEEMIRDLMVVKKDGFSKRADELEKLCRQSIQQGGSSFCNLDRLIQDIRLMSNSP